MTLKGSKMQIFKARSLTRASERIKHDGSLLAKNVVKDPKSDEKCQKTPHHHIFHINVLSSIGFQTGIYFDEISKSSVMDLCLQKML